MKLLPFLAAGLAVLPLMSPAEEIVSESFAFGPEVPSRSGVKEGDFFFGGPVQSGGGRTWVVEGPNWRSGYAEYVADGGIRVIPEKAKGNISFCTKIDPAKLNVGKAGIEASVDFLPGTLWGKNEHTSGITGVWICLRSGGKVAYMALQEEESEHIFARLAFEEKNDRGRLLLSALANGKRTHVWGVPFTMDVHMDQRLTLRVSPDGTKVECELTELQSGNTSHLEMEIPEVPKLDKLQVDLTSLRTIENEIPPVVKKVILKSE